LTQPAADGIRSASEPRLRAVARNSARVIAAKAADIDRFRLCDGGFWKWECGGAKLARAASKTPRRENQMKASLFPLTAPRYAGVRLFLGCDRL